MRVTAGFGGQLEVAKANGTRVEALAEDFRSAMEREHRSVEYRSNAGHATVGVLLSLLSVVAVGVFGRLPSEALGLLIPALVIATAVTAIAVDLGTGARTGAGRKVLLFILVWVSGLILANFDILTAHDPLAGAMPPLSLAALASLLIVNVLFLFLLGARTPLGRRRMDEIEGLRTYLKAAEEDRMNMAGAPEMPPQQYETLLPYAVALDAERPWSESFQTWLTAATAVGATSASDYDGPSWYGGDRDFSIDDIGSTMSSLSSVLSESLIASLPTPDHASSGFSGGGDASGGFSGGGGGGGW